jgi:hypothetical protein
MKHFSNPVRRGLPWLWLLAVLAWAVLPAAATEERFLMVFGTSSAMKKRLPAVEKVIQQLYATDFGNQLGGGDSIGIWTFNDKLHLGEFPLVVWPPEQNKDAADKLFSFVKKQSFSGETSYSVVEGTLKRVIADSEHLTVIMVMDGDELINGTPYDDGINNLLLKTRDERRSLRQPVVLVLRTVKGKYVGGTVSFPPNQVNFPAYPEVPKPAPKPVDIYTPPPEPPPAKVVISGPPLVIVGKSVGTNLDELVKQEQAKAAANPPPVAPKVPETPAIQSPSTNPPPPETPANPSQTSTPVTPVPAVGASANPPTTPPAAAAVPPANSQNPQMVIVEKSNGWMIPAFAGAVGVVLVLIVVMVVLRSRQPRTSLITDSLNNPRPPATPE